MTTLEQPDLHLHPYICERCLEEVPLTKRQFNKAVDHRGRLLCETCLEKKLVRGDRRRNRTANWQTDGCIVTWRDDEGNDHTLTEPGETEQALLRATARIPDGGKVRSICTVNSIKRDLKKLPRRSRRRNTTVDAYSHERNLLAKIGRPDLLPDEAYPRPA